MSKVNNVLVETFTEHLREVRNLSHNSVIAYTKDVEEFIHFLDLSLIHIS